MAGNERTNVKIFPTALTTDVLFYVSVDSTLPKNKDPEYGTSYRECLPHAAPDYPHHKLVFISAADASGLQKWYFAADRANQDSYNFSVAKADIGGNKFDTVQRVYITPRAFFNADSPAMGSAMPNTPAGLFSGQFVLSERQQVATKEQEINSLYVMEVRTYIRRVSIGEIGYDEATGRSTWSFVTLYYSGEIVTGGSTIDVLYADTDNSYWGLQTDGVFRTVERISEKWFAIKSASVLPESPINASGNPAKARIINRTTPLGTDVYFTETGAMPSPAPAYGSSHYSFTNHKLSLITPADKSGLLYTFHYVADRDNQDTYNWEINEGKELIRTYVVPRSTYPSVPTVPEAADLDAQFEDYGFADDTVVPAPEELRSLYVVVKRRFIEPVTINFTYSDALEKTIKITREVISTADGEVAPVSTPGKIVEIQHGNSFHDVRITQEVAEDDSDPITYPYEISSIPITYNRNFPRRLKSVSLVYASAWAYASGQQPSFSEDYYFDFQIEDASPGPYEATARRFITDNPQTVQDDYPLTKVPQPTSEAISIVGWWWHASTETGCSTYASAKEWVVPASIHSEISVTLSPLSTDSSGELQNNSLGCIDTLSATPGADTFFGLANISIDYDVKSAPLGLYEVSVIEMDVSGLYSSPPP